MLITQNKILTARQQFRNTVSPYPIYPKDHSSASPSKTPTFIFPPMR
jgi:hypothetical protein